MRFGVVTQPAGRVPGFTTAMCTCDAGGVVCLLVTKLSLCRLLFLQLAFLSTSFISRVLRHRPMPDQVKFRRFMSFHARPTIQVGTVCVLPDSCDFVRLASI